VATNFVFTISLEAARRSMSPPTGSDAIGKKGGGMSVAGGDTERAVYLEDGGPGIEFFTFVYGVGAGGERLFLSSSLVVRRWVRVAVSSVSYAVSWLRCWLCSRFFFFLSGRRSDMDMLYGEE
jgi:hypothetical protein